MRVSSGTGLERVLARLAIALGLAFALGYAGLGAYHMLPDENGRNLAGHRFGNDFAGFYAAASLAVAGVPEQAYDEAAHGVAAERAAGIAAASLPWFYPPVFLLALEPLAHLPYALAFAVWTGLGVLALVACAMAMRLPPLATVLFLVMPAVVSGFLAGQNAAFMAALLGLGLSQLPRRPYLAGTALSLLLFKPHLAVLIPIALLAGRHWRALLAAAVTGSFLLTVSFLRYGPAAWNAFLDAMPRATRYLADGQAPWAKMVTSYAALREWGLSHDAAWSMQLLSAVAAVLAVVWVCRRSRRIELQGAAVAAAALLTTPYALFYDTAILAPLAGWLWLMGATAAWLAGERFLLAVLWFAPVLFWQVAVHTGWQAWPLLLVGLLMVAIRRALRGRGAADGGLAVRSR